MKRKYFLVPVIAGAALIASCKDKATSDASATGDTTSQQSAEGDSAQDASPVKSTATPEERAKKLGFAKHLPSSIVNYNAMFNGKQAFREFLKTPMGVFLLERLGEQDIALEDVLENDEFAMQLAMYSEEYFTAYGKGTTETYDLMTRLLNRMAYYGGKTGIFVADGAIREGGDFNPSGPEEFLNGPLKGGPKELVKLFGDFNIPAIYQGSKVSDEDMRDMVTGQMQEIGSLFAMAGDAAEEVTVKRNGHEFSGYRLNGSALAEEITEDDMEEMQEVFQAEDINAFKDSLSKKSIVCLTGVVDDYVVLFIGRHEDDFELAENVKDSMCANEEIAFIDGYLDKNIISIGFSDAKIANVVGSVESFALKLVNSLTNGLKEGLGDADSLGDTEDVEVLLQSLTDQGEKLLSMFKTTDLGYVAFIEDGLKAEGFGGSNMPAIDFSTSHTLAGLGNGDNTLVFANWTSNEQYNERALEYLDTLGETSYLITKRIAALDIDDGDFRQFQEGLELYERSFKNDAVELWKALRVDLSGGLGSESAFVIDMNGKLPKIPNIPSVVLEEGKMPRIGYVSTVKDRQKLQSSWTRINASAENILKTISEMSGEEIPMQVPMSSEKDGLKTWFVPIPFQNDDFVPSVSVSDDLFFVSTSKTFSESLADSFKAGTKEECKGAWLKVDFKVLTAYLTQWVDLVDKNADDILPGESAREDFRENKPMIDEAIKAFSSLDSLTLHTRNENGRTRVSFHLKAE